MEITKSFNLSYSYWIYFRFYEEEVYRTVQFIFSVFAPTRVTFAYLPVSPQALSSNDVSSDHGREARYSLVVRAPKASSPPAMLMVVGATLSIA